MTRRMRLVSAVLAGVVAGGFVASWLAWQPRPTPTEFYPAEGGPGGTPVDLETLIAARRLRGWSVLTPPDRPGPYRLAVAHTPMLAGGAGSLTASCPVATGRPSRSVRLEGSAELDQLVLGLEVPGGGLTAAVLGRRGSR